MKTIYTVMVLLVVATCTAQPNKNKVCFTKLDQEFGFKSTFQIKLADLDNDGDLDAISANMHNNYGQILINDGNGIFTDSGQKLTQCGHGVDVGDIDDDGDQDIVMTCANEDRKTRIYFNDGKANFKDSEQCINDCSLSGNSVDLVDIDCDNDLDFVIDYYKDPLSIFINDGNGIFKISDLEFDEGNVLFFDYLNQDSYIDIFMKIPGRAYQVMLNDGKGNFTKTWEYQDTMCTHGYHSVAIDDFDKDGDMDAFICNGDNSNSYESKYFINNGKGEFKDSGKRFGKTKWAWTNTGDLNGDGFIDIFITNFFLPNEVWLNDGKGSFYDSELRLGGNSGSRGFSLGDVDNDNDLDAFIGGFIDCENELWINCFKDK